MEVRECILKRRSIRKFKEQDVDNDTIKDILECAMAAPSACNKQPWEFYVIKNPDLLNEIKTVGRYTNFNSPLVIVVCGNRERTLSDRINDFYIQDCSAAIENILLRVTSLNLGAVWCGLQPMEIPYNKAKEVLKLTDNIEPLGMIHIGYPDEEKEERTQYNVDYVHFYG
jgi:nitroreductase